MPNGNDFANITEQEKDCAFQFWKSRLSMSSPDKIVCDETSLTLDEAKTLWNKHYAECAKHIHDGGTCEMVIWVNMATPQSYGDSLEYISTDAESDGVTITEKRAFPEFKKMQS